MATAHPKLALRPFLPVDTPVLAEIFPGRRIEAALVWTDGPRLMPVPENLWVQTLADLRRAG